MSNNTRHRSHDLTELFLELDGLQAQLGYARALLESEQDPRLAPYGKVIKMIQSDLIQVRHIIDGDYKEDELHNIEEATGQMETYTKKFSQSIQLQESFIPGSSLLEASCNLAQVAVQRVEHQIAFKMNQGGTRNLISAHLYINRLGEFLSYFIHLV